MLDLRTLQSGHLNRRFEIYNELWEYYDWKKGHSEKLRCFYDSYELRLTQNTKQQWEKDKQKCSSLSETKCFFLVIFCFYKSSNTGESPITMQEDLQNL